MTMDAETTSQVCHMLTVAMADFAMSFGAMSISLREGRMSAEQAADVLEMFATQCRLNALEMSA